MAREQDVELAEAIEANARFYAAFRSGDLPAMDALWSARDEVSAYHPNWAGIVGREQVMTSWHDIMVLGEPPQVFERDVSVVRVGKVAVVFCVEDLGDCRMTASNVFVREKDGWRLTSHHARQLPDGPVDKGRKPSGSSGE